MVSLELGRDYKERAGREPQGAELVGRETGAGAGGGWPHECWCPLRWWSCPTKRWLGSDRWGRKRMLLESRHLSHLCWYPRSLVSGSAQVLWKSWLPWTDYLMPGIIVSFFPVACAYFSVALGDSYRVNLIFVEFCVSAVGKHWYICMCACVYVTHTHTLQNLCNEIGKIFQNKAFIPLGLQKIFYDKLKV